MPRELRIMATITLPDDEFEAAEVLMKHKPAIDTLKESLGASVKTEVGEAEAPRQRRPRQPRVRAVEPVSTAPREAA